MARAITSGPGKNFVTGIKVLVTTKSGAETSNIRMIGVENYINQIEPFDEKTLVTMISSSTGKEQES